MPTTETPDTNETKFDLQLWRRFLAIAKPYWFHPKNWTARLLLLAMLGLLLAYTGFTVWINQETGEFTSRAGGP